MLISKNPSGGIDLRQEFQLISKYLSEVNHILIVITGQDRAKTLLKALNRSAVIDVLLPLPVAQ